MFFLSCFFAVRLCDSAEQAFRRIVLKFGLSEAMESGVVFLINVASPRQGGLKRLLISKMQKFIALCGLRSVIRET
jgi:hypothetical protein